MKRADADAGARSYLENTAECGLSLTRDKMGSDAKAVDLMFLRTRHEEERKFVNKPSGLVFIQINLRILTPPKTLKVVLLIT